MPPATISARCGGRHPDCASIKGRGSGFRGRRTLDKVTKRVTRRELNDRFHKTVSADQSDFLLCKPQTQRISVKAKFHKSPLIRRLSTNRHLIDTQAQTAPDDWA